jgi:hypothetical protein
MITLLGGIDRTILECRDIKLCFWVHNNVSTLKYPEGVEPTNHDTMMMMRDIKLWPVSGCITMSLP